MVELLPTQDSQDLGNIEFMDNRKVILITGAAGAFGKAIVSAFLNQENYFTIIACDLPSFQESFQKAYSKVNNNSSRVVFEPLDITQLPAVKSLIKNIQSTYSRIDILINCAGISSGTSIDEQTSEEWDRIYSVNVKGLYFISKYVSQVMKHYGKGKIINISSLAGFIGGIQSSVAYSSSKAAVTCITKSLAKTLGKYGITVNEVAPGTAKTPMAEGFLGEEKMNEIAKNSPLNRLCTPEDIAEAVRFLATDSLQSITGQTIHVNCGIYM